MPDNPIPMILLNISFAIVGFIGKITGEAMMDSAVDGISPEVYDVFNMGVLLCNIIIILSISMAIFLTVVWAIGIFSEDTSYRSDRSDNILLSHSVEPDPPIQEVVEIKEASPIEEDDSPTSRFVQVSRNLKNN